MDSQPAFVRYLEGFLGALSQLLGVQAIWKDADSEAGPPYSSSSCMHRSGYCMNVKANPDRLARCRLEDGMGMRALGKGKALFEPQGPQGFFRTCHAGATDFVFPAATPRRYYGAFFIGPWRRIGRIPYADIDSRLFVSLPVLEESDIEKAGERLKGLLCPVSSWIIQSRRSVDSGVGDQVSERRVQTALELIETHYADGISAAEVADRCGVSVSRFLHIFKEETGSSFSNRMLTVRIARSKELLISTELPISSIAEASGFSSRSLFNRMFLRTHGCTPRDFRRLVRTGSKEH